MSGLTGHYTSAHEHLMATGPWPFVPSSSTATATGRQPAKTTSAAEAGAGAGNGATASEEQRSGEPYAGYPF